MAEIWISAPQSEHLIDGRMLSGRSVSMAADDVDSRVEFQETVPGHGAVLRP